MKYSELQRIVRAPVFSRQDLRQLGARLFSYQLSLWQKRGHLLKLKNGLYAFADRLAELSPEEISGLLYSPSCLSLEKALAGYGLIPEMVYTLTLITPKTTRKFKNYLGSFSYRHVKPSLFFGYRQVKGKFFPYLLAEPEKALLDYIYLNLSKIKTETDIKELRLNWPAAKKTINKARLRKYLAVYGHKRMKVACAQILDKI